MCASLYIVVEGEDPGFDTYVNGQAMARNEDNLSKLAMRLKVRPLLDFFSTDENSVALLLEVGAGNPSWVRGLPPPQWFSPDAGLLTVRRLLDYLEATPTCFGQDTWPVICELCEYETVLRKASERGLRWQLAVSWA